MDRRYLDLQLMANKLGVSELALWWIINMGFLHQDYRNEDLEQPRFDMRYFNRPMYQEFAHIAILYYHLAFGICGGNN